MSDLTRALRASNDALFQVTSQIVGQFRHAPRWEESVPHALEELGSAANASHSFVFELLPTSEHEVVLHRSAEWNSQDEAEQRPGSVVVPAGMFTSELWQEQIPAGVTVDAIIECPKELRDFLTAGDVQSLVLIPIEVGEETWGYLGFDDTQAARDWSIAELSALHLVANALGGMIEQQQLELERARIAAIFENSEDAIISKRLDGTVTGWNGAAERIYGFTREEMVGSSLKRITPPELHSELEEIEVSLKAGRRIQHHETIRRHRNGTELAISLSISPIYDHLGNLTGAVTIARDVTEQVRARQQADRLAQETANERDRLQQVIDVLPEGVLIVNAQGRYVLVNSAAIKIWGHPAMDQSQLSEPPTKCYYPDGSEYPAEDVPLTRSVTRGEVVLGERLAIQNVATGELIPVLFNSTPLRDHDGNITGGVAVFQDITPLKDFEDQKDEFLQTVSHDLKNPLTTIIGNIQLLQRTTSMDEERIETTLKNMESAAGRAISMLDEVLDLTRQQMGRPLDLTLESVDLTDLVTRIVEQHQGMTTKHRIIVRTEEQALYGRWDLVRLERVIENLVNNALQYSPDGGDVIISLGLEQAAEGNVARIEVQDFGLGIPASEMTHLFERFWRGSNVRDQVRGTGLGLTGVKAIVDAHQGEITVESEEGKGTTFTVRLPVDEA